MWKQTALGMAALVVLMMTPTAAKADIGVAGWLRGGFAEQAQGFQWGVGCHVGWDIGDLVLVGAALRFNQVPSGRNGLHHGGDLSLVVRLRLPFWMVQPYATAYAGGGFWQGTLAGNSSGGPFAAALGGEAGVLIEIFADLLLRVGVELQTYHGNFNTVGLVFTGNGVVGLDWVF